MEQTLERLMYASRWLLTPIYAGLGLCLVLLSVVFFTKAIFAIPVVLDKTANDVILLTLTLVDIALVGGLVVMVMFSGYENYISKLDVEGDTEKLTWLGKMDSQSLKNKVAASIVSISSIHLLKEFMELEQMENLEYIKWYVIMHLTFVVSAFAMGYLDKLTKVANK